MTDDKRRRRSNTITAPFNEAAAERIDASTFIGKANDQAVPSFLAGLSEFEKTHVLSKGRIVEFAASQMVFSQGEIHRGIYIIAEGEVRSFYTSASGREITLAYWSKGHFVGGPELFRDGVHTWSGEAACPSQLLFLPSAVIRRLILEIPQFALNAVDSAVFKAKCFSSLLQLLGTRPVKPLLAQLILMIARNQNDNGGRQVILDSRFSQEALSKMVGATRQWVAATIAGLRRQGLLEIVNGRIVIIDLEQLARFTEQD